jgi:hypothetical protein
MRKYCMMLCMITIACTALSQRGKERVTTHMQTIHLLFKNMAGDSTLQTGVGYTNAFGEPLTVRAFKYYISNIQLLYADSGIYKINLAPHLVNETDSTTKQFSFKAPEGTIRSIYFLLGVDSVINTMGVQTGDLDPAKGMYWVWNTGYIMAKLEGTSAVAKSPGRQFTYDIGGYKSGENAARQITLSVSSRPADVSRSGVFYQDTSVVKNIIIKADILKWFQGTNDIMIGEQPMCHEPGTLAMKVADNYQHMFTIVF